MDHTIRPKYVLAGVTIELTPDQVLDLVAAIPDLEGVCQTYIHPDTLLPILALLHDLRDTASPQPTIPPIIPADLAWVEPGTCPAVPSNGDKAPGQHETISVHRDWLREQYIDHGRSTTDIGRELKVSPGTISRYLKAYGIPARPRRGARLAEAEAETEPDPTTAAAG